MIILDTHVLLWLDRNDAALGPLTRSEIEREWRTDTMAVCAISFWEAAMLHRQGRIVLPVSADSWRSELLSAGIQEIALDGRIAIQSTELADLHRDPADRFIIAAALRHDAQLATADSAILGWSGPLRRLDARA